MNSDIRLIFLLYNISVIHHFCTTKMYKYAQKKCSYLNKNAWSWWNFFLPTWYRGTVFYVVLFLAYSYYIIFSTTDYTRKIYTSLSRSEVTSYFLFWVGAILYSSYNVYEHGAREQLKTKWFHRKILYFFTSEFLYVLTMKSKKKLKSLFSLKKNKCLECSEMQE